MKPEIDLHDSLVLGTQIPSSSGPAVVKNAHLRGLAFGTGWRSRRRLRRLGVAWFAARETWRWWGGHRSGSWSRAAEPRSDDAS